MEYLGFWGAKERETGREREAGRERGRGTAKSRGKRRGAKCRGEEEEEEEGQNVNLNLQKFNTQCTHSTVLLYVYYIVYTISTVYIYSNNIHNILYYLDIIYIYNIYTIIYNTSTVIQYVYQYIIHITR